MNSSFIVPRSKRQYSEQATNLSLAISRDFELFNHHNDSAKAVFVIATQRDRDHLRGVAVDMNCITPSDKTTTDNEHNRRIEHDNTYRKLSADGRLEVFGVWWRQVISSQTGSQKIIRFRRVIAAADAMLVEFSAAATSSKYPSRRILPALRANTGLSIPASLVVVISTDLDYSGPWKDN